jgi:hypothetical protein
MQFEGSLPPSQVSGVGLYCDRRKITLVHNFTQRFSKIRFNIILTLMHRLPKEPRRFRKFSTKFIFLDLILPITFGEEYRFLVLFVRPLALRPLLAYCSSLG